MGILNYRDTKLQSEAVFSQFGESKWIPYAKENVKMEHHDANELKSCGLGKFLISVAMGASLEKQIDVIKKYRDKVDVLTCDKGFGPLLEHGVKPDYVMICDCNIVFDRLKPYIEETKDVKLLCTPYANIEWTSVWKGPKYFYVNRDAIKSEILFCNIFGNKIRIIPAGSNVSNAMVIFFLGCDEFSSFNWSCYEKIYLIGYDYSWYPEGHYYAWEDPKPKRYYMNHRTLLDIANNWCFTSENLFFSAKWLYTYVNTFDIPVINCSERGILDIKNRSNLGYELGKINNNPRVVDLVQSGYRYMIDLKRSYDEGIQQFNKIREALIWQ